MNPCMALIRKNLFIFWAVLEQIVVLGVHGLGFLGFGGNSGFQVQGWGLCRFWI